MSLRLSFQKDEHKTIRQATGLERDSQTSADTHIPISIVTQTSVCLVD